MCNRVLIIRKDPVLWLHSDLDARPQPVEAIDDLTPPEDYGVMEAPVADAVPQVGVLGRVQWRESPGQGTDAIGEVQVGVHGRCASSMWFTHIVTHVHLAVSLFGKNASESKSRLSASSIPATHPGLFGKNRTRSGAVLDHQRGTGGPTVSERRLLHPEDPLNRPPVGENSGEWSSWSHAHHEVWSHGRAPKSFHQAGWRPVRAAGINEDRRRRGAQRRVRRVRRKPELLLPTGHACRPGGQAKPDFEETWSWPNHQSRDSHARALPLRSGEAVHVCGAQGDGAAPWHQLPKGGPPDPAEDETFIRNLSQSVLRLSTRNRHGVPPFPEGMVS